MMENLDEEKVVYFVRHAESVANVSRIFQPIDSPLTDNGKSQSILVAKRIAKLSFDVLISSPTPRTKQTTDAVIKETGREPEYNELFVERIKPTRLGGKSYDDEEANKLWKEWEKSLYTPRYKVEDSENFDEIVNRADRALEFLLKRKEKSIVVMTHGYFLRTIVARVLLRDTLTPENFRSFQASIKSENTGITVISYGKAYEGMAWRLRVYNDSVHLG